MTGRADLNSILIAMRELAAQGKLMVSSSELVAATGASPATVKRRLESLLQVEEITRTGQARYALYAPCAGKRSASIRSDCRAHMV